MSKAWLVGTRPRVLVVDDEAPARELISAYLGDTYEVVEADGAARAIDLARLGGFDVVLMDVMMPEMNGYDACRAIKAAARDEHLPVFLVTALDGVDDRIQALTCGAEGLFTKPVDRRELGLRIERVLGERTREAALRRAALESERASVRSEQALDHIVRDIRGAVAQLGGIAAGVSTAGPGTPATLLMDSLDDLGKALDELLGLSDAAREPEPEAPASLAALARAAVRDAERSVPGVPVRTVIDVDTSVHAHSARVRGTIARLVARALESALVARGSVLVRIGARDGAPSVTVSCSPTVPRRRTTLPSLDLVRLAAMSLGANVQSSDDGAELLLPGPP